MRASLVVIARVCLEFKQQGNRERCSFRKKKKEEKKKALKFCTVSLCGVLSLHLKNLIGGHVKT